MRHTRGQLNRRRGPPRSCCPKIPPSGQNFSPNGNWATRPGATRPGDQGREEQDEPGGSGPDLWGPVGDRPAPNRYRADDYEQALACCSTGTAPRHRPDCQNAKDKLTGKLLLHRESERLNAQLHEPS